MNLAQFVRPGAAVSAGDSGWLVPCFRCFFVRLLGQGLIQQVVPGLIFALTSGCKGLLGRATLWLDEPNANSCSIRAEVESLRSLVESLRLGVSDLQERLELEENVGLWNLPVLLVNLHILLPPAGIHSCRKSG